MASLEITGVSKAYGAIKVLDGADLSIGDGEFLTILGPSGCGKSTLLKIIAGVEAQDDGEIAMDGRQIDQFSPSRRNVAMVFQSYALYPNMTVRQNLALPLKMRRLSMMDRLPGAGWLRPSVRHANDHITEQVTRVATVVGIENLLDRRPAQLSGGQRQRVAVARAIVREPAAFLMDEPLSNLDAELRARLRSELIALHRRLGTTIVYVTHDQSEAMTLSTRVAVMMGGRVMQVAPPQQLYADPDHIRVAEFVGSPTINRFAALTLNTNEVSVAGHPVRFRSGLSANAPLSACLRPEALSVTVDPCEGFWDAQVEYVEHLGADLFVHARLPSREKLVVARAATALWPSLPPERRVRLTCAPSDFLFFDQEGKRIRAAERNAA